MTEQFVPINAFELPPGAEDEFIAAWEGRVERFTSHPGLYPVVRR